MPWRSFRLKLLYVTVAMTGLLFVVWHVAVWRAGQDIALRPLRSCAPPVQVVAPSTLVEKILVQEDNSFFQHSGIDWREVYSSALKNVGSAKIMRGGSTLDMQVAKSCYLSQDGSRWLNKLRQIVFTQAIGRRYNKAQILEVYLGAVRLIPNQNARGFDVAARHYFRKDIMDLSRDEEWALVFALRNENSLNPVATGLGRNRQLASIPSLLRLERRRRFLKTSFAPELRRLSYVRNKPEGRSDLPRPR